MKHKKEHKKGQESTIGKIIYGFLLFMPLLAILSTILVNTFNQKANETTETTIVEVPTYYESNEVNTYADLYVNRIYYYANNIEPGFENVGYWSMSIDKDLYNQQYPENKKIDHVNLYNNTNQTIYVQIYFEDSTNTYVNMSSRPMYFVPLSFFNKTNITNDICDKIEYTNFKYQSGTTEEEIITYVQNDIFYYAVDKVENSNLFNWAENSIIYTTMNATCTQLSITTPFIPLLLSYWLIISVIYFLYDIALMLIWAIHDRIHEMKESIS